jgi:uncharacterized ferritin-like protein (DUF455 family)
VELRDWALGLLEGGSLADKLRPLDAPTDRQPGAGLGAPATPARDSTLPISTMGEIPDLRPSALADPRARGLLLHSFANHELLAIELMALALLRFPGAGPAFRRGTAAVIGEEQRHLRMYVGRMRALGVELGDAPLNGFFWRALREVDSPEAFAARMGLVLEQANLDWCARWAARLRALGDGPSAALVDQVRLDEIGHVRHALGVVRRGLGPDEALWAGFQRLVAEPVGAGRARGPAADGEPFDREGRRAAGLPDDFIDQVEVLGRSRGRLPDLWCFRGGAEAAAADPRPGRTAPAAEREVEADLAWVPGLLARPGDLLLAPEAPAPDWRAHLAAAGLPTPEAALGVGALAGRRLGALRPWAWDPHTRALLDGLGPAPPAVEARVLDKGWWAPRLAALWAAAAAAAPGATWDPAALPRVARDLGAARDALRDVGLPAVVKPAFGAAGRGALRIFTEAEAEAALPRLRRLAEGPGGATVSAWLPRRADLSVHGDVSAGGAVQVRGLVRFLVDARGAYLGALPARPTLGLDPALRRRWAGDGRDPGWLGRVAEAVGSAAGQLLADEGYVGPFGVDALFAEHPDQGLLLVPAVEVNARLTMGRVALGLGPRLSPRAAAAWVQVPPRPGAPLEAPARDAAGRLLDGVVWTTDPRRARRLATALVVAPTVEGLRARLHEVGGPTDWLGGAGGADGP